MISHAETHRPCEVASPRVPFAVLAVIAVISSCTGCKPQPQAAPSSTAEAHAFSVTPAISGGPTDAFEEVAGAAGLSFVQQFCDTRIANILESDGSGATVLDYNADGFMDLYVVNPGPKLGITHHKDGTVRQPNRLFRNKGNGRFEDVTQKAGVAASGYSFGAAAGDYDNDGFPDLYVFNVGANILFHNKGNGTFEDVTSKAGVGDAGAGIGAVWLDVDNDGKLDLFVANYLTYDPNYRQYFNPDAYPGPLSYKAEFNVLYRNKGDGTFEDVSEGSGIRVPGHRGMSVAVLDYNEDGAPDLYLCNDATPNLLLVNDGKGRFRDMALKAQVAFNAAGEAAGSMAAAIGDYNGDQRADILVSRLGYGSLYCAWRDGMFEDRLVASGLGPITAQYVGWGCHLADFDNDTDLDAFIANGDPHHMVGWENLLLENSGAGTFSDAAEKGGAFFKTKIRSRCAVTLDYNNDGALDIALTALADRVFLLKNRAKQNRWLTLELQGSRSNRDGFGARITVTADGKTQVREAHCPSTYLGTSDKRVHVGLGASSTADVVIRWPSGQTQKLEKIAANQILKVREP